MAVLTCSASSAAPAPQLLWFRGATQLPDTARRGDTRTAPGEHGGVLSWSAVEVAVTEADVTAEYRCEARHPHSSATVSNTSSIAVQCELIGVKQNISTLLQLNTINTINSAA